MCGALRIIYAVHMVVYDDKIFQLAPYGISATSELIVGFLIFCVPSFPKFFKEMPGLKNLTGKLRSGLGLVYQTDCQFARGLTVLDSDSGTTTGTQAARRYE